MTETKKPTAAKRQPAKPRAAKAATTAQRPAASPKPRAAVKAPAASKRASQATAQPKLAGRTKAARQAKAARTPMPAQAAVSDNKPVAALPAQSAAIPAAVEPTVPEAKAIVAEAAQAMPATPTAPKAPSASRRKAAAKAVQAAKPKADPPEAVPSEAAPAVSEPVSEASATIAPEAASPDAPDAPVEIPEPYDFGAAEEYLMALQQKARALKIPVVIVLEGWSAAGKGTMAGELLEGLDPRGYTVYVPERFSGDESKYPDMRRYWTRMPRQGHISLFIGSWYQAACAESMDGKRARKGFERRLERINLMERMLACDGVLVLKFFINVSKKEQKRRLKALEERKATRGRVTKADWAQNERYDDWRDLYNRMIAATDEQGAQWRVLPGKEKRECKRQLYTAVIDALENVVAQREAKERPWDVPELPGHEPVRTALMPPLCDFEPSQALDEDYKSALGEAQKKLLDLQYELYKRKIPMVLGFEGWDAAGKGGAIRRLTSALDPRGFTVTPICAPTAEEKEHHHLWRFWNALPEAGEIAIFDRTWYGRVMVERIEGFCTEAQWKRAYEEMNLFESDLADSGAIVRKFWLQISNDEQLRRFEARRDTPEKQWKITDEDWRNREKWPQYEEAVNEMLQKTHTEDAPWIVVEANNKQYARLKVLHSVIDAIEERLKKE